MTDVHDRDTRSYNMSKISGKDTRPEMIVRRFLHSKGFRYSLHSRKLPGKPDIVLKSHNTIIDVRGCFWHKHADCKYGEKISTPSKVITLRRESAVARDEVKMNKWKEMGWNVIVIWAECELEPKRKISEKREKILNELLKRIN